MNIKQELKNYRFYSKKDQMDRAGIIINNLIENYPTDSYVLFEYAIYLHKTGGVKGNNEALKILSDCVLNNVSNKLECCFYYVKMAALTGVINSYVEQFANMLIEANYMLDQTEYYYARYYENRGLNNIAIVHYQNSADLGYEKSKKRLIDYKRNSNLCDENTIKQIAESDATSLFDLDNKIVMLRKQAKFDEIANLLRNYESKYKTFNKKTVINSLFGAYVDIGYFNDAINLFEKNKKYISDPNFITFIEARIDLINNDYKEAEIKFNKLIMCKNDYSSTAYLYLAQLANIGKKYELEEFYYDKLTTNSKASNDAYLRKAYYYIRKGNKIEALKCLKKIQYFYLRKHRPAIAQLNAMLDLDLFEYENNYYTVKQIRNYSDELALQHIKRHTAESDYYKSRISFDDSIDLKKLFFELKDNLDKDCLVYSDLFDHYIIEYNDAGSYEDIKANYIEVVTIVNTNNIITMYPVASNNFFAVKRIDKEPKKVKRISQVDKFNRKYGIK